MRVQSDVSVHHLPVSEEEQLLVANFIPVEINPLLNSALAFSSQGQREMQQVLSCPLTH